MKLFNRKVNVSIRNSVYAVVIGASVLASGAAMAGKPLDGVSGGSAIPFRLTWACDGRSIGSPLPLVTEDIPAGKQFRITYVSGSLMDLGNLAVADAHVQIELLKTDYQGTEWGSVYIPTRPTSDQWMRIISENVDMTTTSAPTVRAAGNITVLKDGDSCNVTMHGFLEDI